MKLQLATLLLLSAVLSPAAIVVGFGNASGDLDNIHLGDEISNNSIDGEVKGFSVLFTSQNHIDLHGGGQASIREDDGPIDGAILFQIPGATFSLFGVNPQRGGKPKKGAALLISAVGTLTTVNHIPLALGPGENRLYVQGQGESLLSVMIGVWGDTYDNYKQPRVGGIEALPIVIPPPVSPPAEAPPVEIPPTDPFPVETSPVPESSSLALIGTSLPLLAWLAKRYCRTTGFDQR